jgi:hypothetical protein
VDAADGWRTVVSQSDNLEVYDKYISKYIAYYPLIAVIIATSFDVGCFYAIDISLFTLFSLSEHILFALEALPLAIAILLMIAVFLPAMLSRFKPGQPSSPPPLSWWQKLLFIIIVCGPFVIFLGYIIYDIWRTNPLILLALAFLLLPIVGSFIIDPKFKGLYVSVAALLICLTLSFSFGVAFGVGILTNLQPVTTVKLANEQATINGRIVRSGERGVLVYEREANLMRFIPWEKISSIETPPIKFGEQ